MSNQPPAAPPPGQGREDDLPPWRQQPPSRSGWINEADGPEDYEQFDDTAFTQPGPPPGLDYDDPVADDDMHLSYGEAPSTSQRFAAQPSTWMKDDSSVREESRLRQDAPVTAVPRLEARPGRPTGRNTLKVGLWGSPSSGKTTYLAALRHAIGTASRANIGSWNIYPLSDPSAELLIRFTHELVSERKFPEATDVGAVVPLEWLFVGDLAGSRFGPRRSIFRRAAGHDSRFVLDLVDVSGEAFGEDTERVSREVATRAIDHLAAAQGLIYLFDPVTEKSEKNASTYVNRTITGLSQRLVDRGREERYLPHQVSICITKFDHPEVFQQARRAGLVNYGADGLPRVLDQHAEQFFDALCDGTFWGHRDERGEAGAQFIRNTLKNSFHPANIRYFVTSSIGFWHPPGWNGDTSTFDPEFFANFNEIGDGKKRIKGPIHPINVLEPLIFLHQRMARAGMSRR
jgi:hypothetical protein